MAWEQIFRNDLPGNESLRPKVDRFFEHRGVLVVVHSVGQYPELVNTHGESSRDVPHIELVYDSSFVQSPNSPAVTYYRSVQVCCMTWSPTQQNLLVPFTYSTIELDEPITDKQPLIERGLDKIDAAIEHLGRLPALIAADVARIRSADAYPAALSRNAYEAACEALGVDSRTDHALTRAYPLSIAYPQYSAEAVLGDRVATKRSRGIHDETVALDLPKTLDRESYEHYCREHEITPVSDRTLTNEVWAQLPSASAHGVEQTLVKARIAGMYAESRDRPIEPGGQLWEPCPVCGNEPIYLPKHVCLDCWDR